VPFFPHDAAGAHARSRAFIEDALNAVAVGAGSYGHMPNPVLRDIGPGDRAAVVTGFAPPRKVEVVAPPAKDVTRIERTTSIKRSVRVRQVEGMFDLPATESIHRTWDYRLELPESWSVGMIVGPSGSGKTTLAREWFGDRVIGAWPWPAEEAIVDGFPADMPIQEVTGLLSSVGFSSPPGWTKPYHVLSNGEKFRVDVARTLAEKPELAVIDEFTSVVDRTVARIGSAAVAKAVRASGRRLVAVSCHYDIAEWLCPDWILDVETGELTRRSLRRPPLDLVIRRADRSAWKQFAHHHYLNHDLHKAAACFVAKVEGRPAAFVAVLHAPHPTHSRWRASRIVCLPDFQGVGIGSRLTDVIAAAYSATGKEFSVVTSHPAMIAGMARSAKWRCTKAYDTNPPSMGISGLDTSGSRLTCGFVFSGEPNPDAAKSLGLLKP
jgi:ABC-type lipoprotein export system ATPase subunit/GNAT superfamily N-acetyltransferase